MGEENERVDQFFEISDLPHADWEEYWNGIVIADKDNDFLLNYGDFVAPLDRAAILDWGLYKAIRLQGPPGIGKTTKALGFANEMAKTWQKTTGKETKLLMLKAESCFSHFLGAAAKNLDQVFEAVHWLARRYNLIIAIDEVESLAFDRKAVAANPNEPSDILRGVNKLLTELDRLRQLAGVVVIMTSNLAEVIDEALTSRTDLILDFDLPDPHTRARIIGMRLDKLGAWLLPLTSNQIEELADLTEGFSGRDLVRVSFWALMVSGKQPHSLGYDDYVQAIAEMRAQVDSQNRKEPLPIEKDEMESELVETESGDEEPRPAGFPAYARHQSERSEQMGKKAKSKTEDPVMEGVTKEREMLERRLNLGLTRLPGEGAQMVGNTVDHLAELIDFPARKVLQQALSRSQRCVAMLLSAQVLEHIEVHFEDEVLRINLLYFPDSDAQEDNLDLSVIEYAGIKTEQMEIRLQVTDLKFAQLLGADIFTDFRIPDLKFSLVADGQEPTED